MAAGEILEGIGGLINAGTGIYNAVKGNQINTQNYELQKDMFNYQKDLQKQIFEREDTAVQRRAADLQNSGFSKWLAAGGQGASSGAIINTQAPQKQFTPVDLQNAILGISSLSEMMYGKDKMIADTNFINANAERVRADTQKVLQETLTEMDKRLNMAEERGLTKQQRINLERDYNELTQTWDWYMRNTGRPPSYKPNSRVAGLVEDGGVTLSRIYEGTIGRLYNLLFRGKKK